MHKKLIEQVIQVHKSYFLKFHFPNEAHDIMFHIIKSETLVDFGIRKKNMTTENSKLNISI